MCPENIYFWSIFSDHVYCLVATLSELPQNLELRRNFFSQRVAEKWNELPLQVKNAHTVSSVREGQNAIEEHIDWWWTKEEINATRTAPDAIAHAFKKSSRIRIKDVKKPRKCTSSLGDYRTGKSKVRILLQYLNFYFVY